MKAAISRLLITGTLALALPSTHAIADEAPKLHDLMEQLDDAYKAFRRETDPAKALPNVQAAQAAAWQAMPLLPEMVEKMPDGPAKAIAAASYRTQMAAAYLALAKLEAAFLKGDMETVAALVAELRDGRKVAHEEFIPE